MCREGWFKLCCTYLYGSPHAVSVGRKRVPPCCISGSQTGPQCCINGSQFLALRSFMCNLGSVGHRHMGLDGCIWALTPTDVPALPGFHCSLPFAAPSDYVISREVSRPESEISPPSHCASNLIFVSFDHVFLIPSLFAIRRGERVWAHFHLRFH